MSAEFLLQRWMHMLGPAAANERYQHLDVLVRTRCAEAHDEVNVTGSPFGHAMLSSVRTKISQLAQNKDLALGLTSEQLMGFVSLATQECRQWWSEVFDLSGGSA